MSSLETDQAYSYIWGTVPNVTLTVHLSEVSISFTLPDVVPVMQLAITTSQ